ncbi:hypothetical protein R70723_18280 [Paenibacillus sp. FSL R7-0273]|uniref:hypothetical protein n=1 Tax=Paenibacillus sp. FSL R7-0273 TaxID=1536772 RepID=UPI0004F8D012|nr:hypothetical protein [Paenibacillus sp. FSL R7-0273]AIQ47621.1 hypothetical protein R70723_18280 [Paenibacillus sp. FSL R7-0273]OMF95826.1 hypothetical protein BK144_04350 [Paenibacillus sp. FSL R7-0273]
MHNDKAIMEHYEAIEERVIRFITNHSGVEYMKDSEQIVEGGVFAWAKLRSGDKEIQTQLRLDYVKVFELARQRMERAGSEHLSDFDRSSEAVLHYIRQDSILWIPSLEAAAEAARTELALQKFLLAQT